MNVPDASRSPRSGDPRPPARRRAALAWAIAAIGASAPLRAATPIDIPGFLALPRPAPSLELRYGDAPSQGIDVFLPDGPGPFPVAVLVHGGCWSRTTAAREQLRHLGADLAAHGIAAWSIGYRRANEDGGGYPGTFLDVATAVDRLRDDAARLRLDPSRSVLVGHSAGGHLALWAASRERLPPASALRRDRPYVPRRVIALAGIGDLERYAPMIPGFCGAGVAEALVGTPGPQRPDVYADTSPAALAAADVEVVMVSGMLDRLVPPYVAHDYAARVQDTVRVRRITLEDAGHFDLVATSRPAWRDVRRLIAAMLAP